MRGSILYSFRQAAYSSDVIPLDLLRFLKDCLMEDAAVYNVPIHSNFEKVFEMLLSYEWKSQFFFECKRN